MINKKNNKKIFLVVFSLLTLIIILLVFLYYKNETNLELIKKNNEQNISKLQAEKEKEIKIHYNEYVITVFQTSIYDIFGKKIGEIGKNIELTLGSPLIDAKSDFFYVKSGDFYIKYDSVMPIKELSNVDQKYKKYIPFNENILTKKSVSIYTEDGFYMTISKFLNEPIIIKDIDKSYFEYNNRLVYINNEDVSEFRHTNNTSLIPRKNVAVITYHAIYDPATEICKSVICLTDKMFEIHMEYLSTNNYLTMTMKEFEYFMDGKIRIPTLSVVVTIDDGFLGQRAKDILGKYKVNATIFLIASLYKYDDFKTDYLDVQSHTYQMHTLNECPDYGAQGGGILCLSEEHILNDLSKASELLNGSKILAYPFFEYNNYAISLVKKAGYTMAFKGGYLKAYPGENKYVIPRYTIFSYDDVEKIKDIILEYD